MLTNKKSLFSSILSSWKIEKKKIRKKDKWFTSFVNIFFNLISIKHWLRSNSEPSAKPWFIKAVPARGKSPNYWKEIIQEVYRYPHRIEIFNSAFIQNQVKTTIFKNNGLFHRTCSPTIIFTKLIEIIFNVNNDVQCTSHIWCTKWNIIVSCYVLRQPNINYLIHRIQFLFVQQSRIRKNKLNFFIEWKMYKVDSVKYSIAFFLINSLCSTFFFKNRTDKKKYSKSFLFPFLYLFFSSCTSFLIPLILLKGL